VELFRKKDSRFYWYDFKLRGKRYRRSTKETNKKRAGQIAALRLSQAMGGTGPLDRKAPSLQEFSTRFLSWVEAATLAGKSRAYYYNGWRLLSTTKIAGMRLDHITKDDVEALTFSGSASNSNCALRTLRRMLHKAEEWNLIARVPKFKLLAEYGRRLRLDEDAEQKLLVAARACNWKPCSFELFRDVIILARDAGMRNRRELYRLRLEDLDWNNRIIFVPDSKTADGRRMIPMSDRVCEVLRIRAGGRREGWLFPSNRSKCGHLTEVAKQFCTARAKAGLPDDLVLYCSRHDYGTRVLNNTGNLAAVMKTMGHKDVRAAMQYQHPELEMVRAALNQGRAAAMPTSP
jgi:integrase